MYIEKLKGSFERLERVINGELRIQDLKGMGIYDYTFKKEQLEDLKELNWQEE